MAGLQGVLEQDPEALLVLVPRYPERFGRAFELAKSAGLAVRRRLGADGRLVLRPSGTEPVVRVMVEAADSQVAAEAAEEIVQAIEAAGAPAGG